MGALAKFLLILDKLVKSGVIKKVPQAIKFAEQQFGKVTPLLKKQIEKVFENIKKPVVGKPGKKEGAVIPMVKEGTKKAEPEGLGKFIDEKGDFTQKSKDIFDEGIKGLEKSEGIETLDEFNLSKDDPMGDFEKIVKGEGDTGLPSQFTNKDIEEAIDNVSPGFVAGDTKYNAELVAEELAVSKGIDYYGLPVKDRAQIYGRAFDGLSKQRMKGELSKTDELMNFFRKEIEKADAPKLDSKENVQLGIEKLRNPKRPGGPLDPAIGVTRTLARRVLEKRGIEIGKKDPIDVFNDTFGEAIIDLKNLGEEMIEADQTGRNLKPMDDLLEIEGFFDMEIPENPNKGIPNEEMIEMLEKDLEEKTILEDFDPTFRKPNAEGGLMRTKLAMGSDDEPLKPDPTKPINPFAPKPTGPVLPDKSMMAEFSLQDYMDEFERVFPEMRDKRGTQEYMDMLEDYFRGLASKDRTSSRVQAASGGLAEILKV